MNRLLVPKDFQVPKVLEVEKFRLRMLTIHDVVKDYDAVMSSVDHLHGVFGPLFDWPTHDLTLEDDLIELGWHQSEFLKRFSFAYTVMSLDENMCLGCVYIFPTKKIDYEAAVYMWVRKSAYDDGIDPVLFDVVKKWIEEKWPFNKVAYPGRDIDWKTWKSLK